MTTNTVSAVGLLIRTFENISQEAQYYILTLHSENVYRYQTKHEFSPAFADIHMLIHRFTFFINKCSWTGYGSWCLHNVMDLFPDSKH